MSRNRIQCVGNGLFTFRFAADIIHVQAYFLLNLIDRKAVLFTSSQNRCTCGNCQVMGRAEACVCCREIEAVQNKNIEAVTSGECEDPPQCITQHPGFHAVCLNRWVL